MPNNTFFQLIESPHGDSDRPFLNRIYEESFPPAERRMWKQVEQLADDKQSPMTLLKIVDSEGRAHGFFTLWRFQDMCYIEHFAVSSSSRGAGIGAKALRSLLDKVDGRPVVIEVEPPEDPVYGPMAARRVDFYSRMGFVPFPSFRYVQPSYGFGLPPVELMLMATRDDVDLERATHLIHRNVYLQN